MVRTLGTLDTLERENWEKKKVGPKEKRERRDGSNRREGGRENRRLLEGCRLVCGQLPSSTIPLTFDHNNLLSISSSRVVSFSLHLHLNLSHSVCLKFSLVIPAASI
ncbi:hypothetical protein I3842_15G073100 [Carya illinoinensis]|uniref:Uncharacterized protein n=1 Tax=Carya illinoinensis TaxID=32201 RepID=A0A922ABA2_CARIL|nr:hypothetical protein I3842_15G073100 [Carya illinoinensis]